MGLLLVACGNNDPNPGAGGAPPAVKTTGTPTATPTTGETPGETSPTETPSAEPTTTPTDDPTTTPTTSPSAKPTTTPTPTVKPFLIYPSMLLTGKEMAKGDPGRKWAATSQTPAAPVCGISSTRGSGVQGTLRKHFSNDLDASGGQWLTRYSDEKAAKAAYEDIIATIKSCKALKPGKTHARKLTENRPLAVGDATRIIRWYDYALPSDPGSENGGFPYAVTLKGKVVSVLAFGEMGPGIKSPSMDRLAKSAAAHLPS
jgi:hypothetical protein